MGYDRLKAQEYAYKFALDRNKKYYDFSSIGGDCTNFVSQCLFAGVGQMNEKDWFYFSLNNRSPSWTGVNELFSFLISNTSYGAKGEVCSFRDLEIGDIVQLRQNERFSHSLFVTKTNKSIFSLADIFVSTHSTDFLNIGLNNYSFREIRFIKIF